MTSWDLADQYDYGFFADRREAAIQHARLQFELFVEEIPARTSELAAMVAESGFLWGVTDTSLRELNDWFIPRLEADFSAPLHLSPAWSKIVFDLGTTLGLAVLDRLPGAHWSLYRGGKTDIDHLTPIVELRNGSTTARWSAHRKVLGYAMRILEDKGAGLAHGVVNVRGRLIDVDGVLENVRGTNERDDDYFVKSVHLGVSLLDGSFAATRQG